MFEINVINPKVYIFALETQWPVAQVGAPRQDQTLSSAVPCTSWGFIASCSLLRVELGWAVCSALNCTSLFSKALSSVRKRFFPLKAEVLEMAVTQKKSWGAAAPCCPGVWMTRSDRWAAVPTAFRAALVFRPVKRFPGSGGKGLYPSVHTAS